MDDVTVDADLAFSVEKPGLPTFAGILTGHGKSLELRIDHPSLLGGRSDAAAIRGVAGVLAGHGLRVTVLTPAGALATLGATRASWWQRRVTGSRHVRIEGIAALWTFVRSRRHAPAAGLLPASELVPPRTPFPIAPTLRRARRRRVTTTHDPLRGGKPRLIMSLGDHPHAGDTKRSFALRDDVTVIGSAPTSHIRLAGLAPSHAEIVHDTRDEFVLRRTDGNKDETRVNGAPVDGALLRTGTGVTLGRWSMSFFREEYADHGRPYGGRIGGELGHQRSQPSRAAIQSRTKGQS
jgi:hypothetical protein